MSRLDRKGQRAHLEPFQTKQVGKEIHAIKEKPGTMQWDNRKDALLWRPLSLKASEYKNANLFESSISKERDEGVPCRKSDA